MAERAHLSIGEVLSLLQGEHPDITISKIRFLESQGLLDPERTPSGYRKFYEGDIDRLRWILRQQKDNFLPLRVIKDRLAEVGPSGAPPDDIGPPPAQTREPPRRPAARRAVAPMLPSVPTIFEHLQPGPAEPARAPAEPVAPTQPSPAQAPSPRPAPAQATPRQARSSLDPGPSAVSLTTDELAAAAGCTDKTLEELVRYGLISGRAMGRDTLYDEEALIVARLAAAFGHFGVEARHLRMYKVAAEREAGFLEQVVLPLMKQRNPSARRQAVDNLNELTELGDSLRGALLRNALKGYSR
ncbi:MAG: MerR family transcriptional regulator [Acidimicrobiales bacterium]